MPSRDEFIRINRNMFLRDSNAIVAYSDSLGLNAVPTSLNLWLTLHKGGEGDKIKNGERVSYEYCVRTLSGDTLYDSGHDGIRSITVGRQEDVIGIDEALYQLHRGDSATVILIPEKAFGLAGDQKRVFGRCIVRYDIKILK